MRKARPVRLACPALMLLRAGSVFTRLPPSVATRHLPPQAGGGTWYPLFLPLGGVSSVPLKNAKSRLAPARWLKPTPYACPAFLPLGGVSSVRSRMQKAGLRLLGGLKPTPYAPPVFPPLVAVIAVVSCQRRAGREWGRRNGVLRCRAVSPTRRAGGQRFPALGFSGGI